MNKIEQINQYIKENKTYLCYVDGDGYELTELYFTNIPLSLQWGDDWDDKPYEHNASLPYETIHEDSKEIDVTITKVIIEPTSFKQKVITPCTNSINSPYSVKDINSKVIPWIVIDNGTTKIPIFAGESIKETIAICKVNGIKVYTNN